MAESDDLGERRTERPYQGTFLVSCSVDVATRRAGGPPLIQDADQDGLENHIEVCRWMTSTSSADTDSDGLGDCGEAFDVNGHGVLTNGDAVAILTCPPKTGPV